MTDFISTLTHARKFKAAVSTLALTELHSFQEKLLALIDTREKEEAEAVNLNAERNAQLNEIKRKMLELGLSAEDLNHVTMPKKKREPRPAKYQIEVDGEMLTWTGQGRMPTELKKEIDEGFELSDFLIVQKN
ncbi:histone family protein nucleoid-structuring protein H-NS (plasmid) [Shewanella baltica OS223]|uniref:DNA-binding protein n=1 Tax=Shewanella septentrionalis TaxID=2952223 RepID=A0A9X3B3P3_9GAMM|nr:MULTISPECIES: H-NS family nucleoid-associated regulatory protein [Shewanella]ACK48930.1 histone family protein nucleoid-structuring protein H-NS [Shewanella baltica OS223]AEG13601.1 histone family protein nucleoid-structuring protein H-NS [Shewanella baltica BA175]MCT7947928.1 H-NS histone family protein [Shewanella septentrionalis]